MTEPIQNDLESQPPQQDAPDLTCYRHPDRKTALRCAACLNSICPDCARSSPTGYICPDCLNGRRKVFDTAFPRDYFVAALLAALLGFAGAYLSEMIAFGMIWGALIGGGITGTVSANIIRFATGKRRSLRLIWTAVGGGAGGAFVYYLPTVLLSGYWAALLRMVLFIAVMANVFAANYGTALRLPKR